MIDGVCSNSASVKSHCVSAIINTSLGRAGVWIAAGMVRNYIDVEQRYLYDKMVVMSELS